MNAFFSKFAVNTKKTVSRIASLYNFFANNTFYRYCHEKNTDFRLLAFLFFP